jgi:signal transduction histidine kinase
LDTKWKSRMGILAWLLLFAYGVSGVLSALINENDYIQPSYYNTSKFESHIKELTKYIHAFEITYQSKEELMQSITITNNEIEAYRSRYGDLTEQLMTIEQQYKFRIQNAKDEGNQQIADLYIKERDTKIEQITNIFENDAHVEEIIVKDKQEKLDAYFAALEEYRPDYEKYKNTFAYYLKNASTGEIYTNLPTEDVKSVNELSSNSRMRVVKTYPTKNQTYLEISHRPLVYGYNEYTKKQLSGVNALYEGNIAISKQIPNSNFIMVEFHNFGFQRWLFWIYTAGAAIALLISLILGKKKYFIRSLAPRIGQRLFNKIPIDAAFVLFGITVIATLSLFFDQSYLYYRKQISGILEIITYQLMTITILFGLTIIQGAYLYQRIKGAPSLQKDWANSIFARFVRMLRNAFLNRKVGTQVFLIFTTVFLFGLGTALIFIEEAFLVLYVPALLLIGIPLFVIIVKRTDYFNRIINNTSALAQGEFEPDLEIKGKSVLAKLAKDINRMKYGFKTSQKAQAQSERLKTELITNVSHDLRTPLTSIMTYIELLKNPALAEDERHSYIGIIDRKSKRLKVLIDDLFEASKMASGNIELIKEKVDIVQLLQQALAEYNESIRASSIQFRVTNPSHPIYALVDGQKLWRVFENLIGNILKYSLEHTRAYIHVTEEKGQVIITFKNISEYELSENIDELFERFKRGDDSRHTDGSGLGLAIAKSIIDLHEGTLNIDVDGDLFKVTITILKAAE